MATVYFSGYVFKDNGDAVSGATVSLLEAGTTTEEDSTTTDSNGFWSFNETDDDKYDVKITQGSQIRYRKWADEIQVKALDVRNNEGEGVPAATFTNFADGDDMEIVHYRGLRGTGAADDNLFFRYYMDDASGNITEMANMAVNLVDASASSEDVKIIWQIKAGASMVDALTISSTSGAVVSTTFNQNALTFGTGADTDISLTFNANSYDGVITWMEDEDYFAFSDEILMNTTEKIHLRDTAIYINSSADGQLDLVADTEIQIAATTIDINGAVAFDGALTGITTISSGAITSSGNITSGGSFIIGSASIAEAELEMIDGITAGTAAASKAVVLDGSKNIATIGTIASAAITASGTSSFGSGTTIGNLTLANGSITDSGGALDFGNETLTTTGVVTAGGFTIGSAAITEAELEILDGASVTTTELNLIDGGTARGTTAVASGDGLLVNDGGTMRMTNVDTVSTYFSSHNVGGGNIVTTGALDSGSITSNFGTINNGSSTITTTGAADLGATTVDSLTSTGDITTTGQATDWDLVDNNASALSFDASGKTGILDIVTTDSSEGVTMSGTLGVTGTATLATVDIGAGAIDGTAIGASSASTIVGTTIDASTDFTIGDTVITNGTITDTSGLTIAAAVDLGSNTLTSTGSMQIRTIDYSDGDLSMTIADGGGVTFAQDVALSDDKSITLGDEGQIIFSDVAPSTDHSATGIVIKGTLATGVTAGMALYLKADGEYDHADKDTEGHMPAVGVALEAAGSARKILIYGVYVDASLSLTRGEELYVGDDGAVTHTVPGSGDFLQRVGVALTTTSVLFMPSLDVIEHA